MSETKDTECSKNIEDKDLEKIAGGLVRTISNVVFRFFFFLHKRMVNRDYGTE